MGDDSIRQVKLLDPTMDQSAVSGRDVGPTGEMKGHVVRGERGDGLEQFENPFVGEPVGDVEQCQAATGPERRYPIGPGRWQIATRRNDLDPHGIESVIADQLARHNRSWCDNEIAMPVGGDVESPTKRARPRAVGSSGMLVNHGDRERSVISSERGRCGPGVQAVDHDDVSIGQSRSDLRASDPHVDPGFRRGSQQVLVVTMPAGDPVGAGAEQADAQCALGGGVSREGPRSRRMHRDSRRHGR